MGMYNYDYFDYAAPALEAFAGFMAVFLVFLALILLVWAIVSYVFYSVGLYTIAKRRGIHHSWLAWIPVGSDWLLGSVSDQYQYLAKRQNTRRRTVLLVLNIVMWVVFILQRVCSGAGMIGFAEESGAVAGGMLGLSVILGLVCSGVGIALAIMQLIALFDLYDSCNPSSSVLKLVFSILFAVTLPFFVFASRKKDLGMPARRSAASGDPMPEVFPQEVPVEAPVAEEQPEAAAPVADAFEEAPEVVSDEQPE